MLEEFPIKNDIDSLFFNLNDLKKIFQGIYRRLNNVWE